jgi:lipoyl(octanoyl) transferase
MTEPRCRVLPFHIADGPWQMAADQVILEAAAAGIASLRFYGWPRANLSLGYFQHAAECQAYPGLADLPLVRRASGGAALVHHLEATYALGLPAGKPWHSPGESWARRMHTLIALAVGAIGLQTHLCDPQDEKKLGEVLCFLHETPDDLLLQGHKVVGSAQRKLRGALMQHGGILLARSPATPELPGIRELAGVDLTAKWVSTAVQAQLTSSLGWVLEPGDWTTAEKQRIEELIRTRYAHPAWNYKR